MSLSRERNKWLKYRHMRSFSKLKPYIPKTEIMGNSVFWKLMDQYAGVVVKPIDGSRGRGVIKVLALKHHRYLVHVENRVRIFKSKEETYGYLLRKVGSHQTMVQQRIPRARINNRQWDMRVIIQRKKHSSSWTVTAKVAKVVGKGYFVSNITRSKGKLISVRKAIKRSDTLKGKSKTKLLAKLDRISIRSAEKLSYLFPHHRIYGLDVGLDKYGHFWIIEANLFPSKSHFQKFKDKSMLSRIKRYEREVELIFEPRIDLGNGRELS